MDYLEKYQFSLKSSDTVKQTQRNNTFVEDDKTWLLFPLKNADNNLMFWRD